MRRLLYILALSLCIITCTTPRLLAGDRPTVILVLIDRLGLDDLLIPEAESIREMVSRGGVGLANVRTAGSGSGSAYLTLGAGGRALAGTFAGLSFHVGDMHRGQPVADLFAALTGEEPEDGLIHIGVQELRTLAEQNNRETTPGLLGQALRSEGIATAVYGNSDTLQELRRYGVLVAMDTAGRVERGRIGEDSLVTDPNWPTGVRTDYDVVLEETLGHLGTTGLVVVELGDLARLEDVQALLTPSQAKANRTRTIERIANLLRRLEGEAAQNSMPTTMILLAPSPSAAAASAGYLLSPVIIAELGPTQRLDLPEQGGLITSHTTRRQGIVANVDVGATILNLFDLSPLGSGRAMKVVAGSDPWGQVQTLYEQTTRVHSQRLPLIQPYFFIQLATVLASTLLAAGAFLKGWQIGRWRYVLMLIHLLLVAFPLALLVLPLLPGVQAMYGVWMQVAAIAGVFALCSWAAHRYSETLPFTILCGITVAVILIDLLTGTRLLQTSHLGYDPIGGSRYYGIGNEYMGVLLGTATIAAGGVLDVVSPRSRKVALWGIAGVFIAIVVLLASPVQGANVGGTISAVVGLGAVLILFRQYRLRIRHLIMLGVLVAIVVGAAAWYDTTVSGPDTSHLGNAVQLVGSEGGDPLWNLFERKVEMNARLIRLTVWSRAFFVSLLVAILFAFYRPSLVGNLLHRHPYMGLAIRGSLVGAFVVLLANDSGIVGAATLMIPVISTLLYLVLCQPNRKERPSRTVS